MNQIPLHEQFLRLLERANRPLIILPKHAQIDDFVSGFAVAGLISKLNKPIEICSTGGLSPSALDFLENPFPLRGDLPNIAKLTLVVDAKSAKIDELSYDVKDDELHIHLMPKSGVWKKEDVSIHTDTYRYDLIITIGGETYEDFGEIFKKYTDFFFKTPIINIDHKASNDHFGQMNIVDINAVSSTQVCYEICKAIDISLIDEQMATFLLTGMISKTKSFKSDKVTPYTLKIASELVAHGARRDDIVQNLYRTRTVETLRLWGRALARLKSDSKNGLVWTLLTKTDFVHAGAKEAALDNIVDELIMSSPNAKIAVIFYEKADNSIAVMIHAQKPYDALSLGAPFRSSGTREESRLSLPDLELVAAERKVITHIKQELDLL